MRNPTRISYTIDLIKQIWTLQSDLRFNQLISILQFEFCERNQKWFKEYYEKDYWISGMIMEKPDLFHLEDMEFCVFLEEYLLKLQEGLK